MGWIIYNSKGEPLVTQEVTEHEHTAGTGEGGALTDDEHLGFSQYAEAALPDAPASSKGRLFAATLDENDSISPGSDLTGLYVRRPDGLMVKLNDDFPYSTKMRHPQSASYPHGDSDEVPMTNSWVNQGSTNAAASFTKDFLGCVWAQGLLKSGTIGGMPMFTLPAGSRYTGGHILWPTVSNDLFARVDQQSDGAIEPATGSNAWFSIAPVAYPVDDRVDWHEVGGAGEPAFENSWVNYAAGGWGTAAFAKDAIGRVWIKGFVKSGADGTAIFTLPEGYRPTKDILRIGVAWSNVISQLQVLSDGIVKSTLIGAGTNSWVSVTMVFTADGETDWHEVGGAGEPAFENSWVNFGGAWDTTAFYKDACGVVHVKGLIKLGTIGAVPVFVLPMGYRPRAHIQFASLSNNAFGRIDVDSTGNVNARIGNNAWFSVHCSFVAEQ